MSESVDIFQLADGEAAGLTQLALERLGEFERVVIRQGGEHYWTGRTDNMGIGVRG